jgi:hypothetical protein
MIGVENWRVEANSPYYLHGHWWTGVFGKDAIPDGDGRAGGEEEMGLLRGRGNFEIGLSRERGEKNSELLCRVLMGQV